MFKTIKNPLHTAKMSGKDIKKPKQKKQTLTGGSRKTNKTIATKKKGRQVVENVPTPKQKLTQPSGRPAQVRQEQAAPKPTQFKTMNGSLSVRLARYFKGK